MYSPPTRHKRWGFASAAAAPRRAPAGGVLETVLIKPTKLPTDRVALPWVHRRMPPAPNAWGSLSLLSLKKGEGSGSFVNINDRPSLGSSSTSTDESDLLDSPVACGRTTYAKSHDCSAPKHLQMEDREGQVHKQECISMGSTPASDTADANRTPLIPNTISPVKNTEIKIMEQIDPKVHSHGRIIRGCTPASGPAGVSKGFLIHNVIPSAKNNENSMTDHIAWRSASQSLKNSSPERLQMENRQRRVHPLERVLREVSNIAENKEDATTVSGTDMNARNAEPKPHVLLSTQSKTRPGSLCGTESTETSGLRKAPVSGVVINSSINTMQAALARGFIVGSIMLWDASVASVNQGKPISNEVDDNTTNSCASPKQTKQLGKNHELHVKDPHGGDSIMCTDVKEPTMKERPVAGGVNCMAIPAPNQPAGNQSTISQDSVPAKTSEMESKELHLLDRAEQGADYVVLKTMQELFDQLEQIEKLLDSIHVVAVSHSEPTQMVSLPGYTRGNMCTSYPANVCGITQGASVVPTTQVLPVPIFVPENNTPNGSSAPLWTRDAAEGISTSDMSNFPVVGTSITGRSGGSELTESIYGVGGQMDLDLHRMQVIGGMSYEAVASNPEILYHHTGPAHQHQDVSYHSSSGTGVYWPLVGTGHPGYQLMPVASPGAAYTGSAMANAGHLVSTWTWGPEYYENVYYA